MITRLFNINNAVAIVRRRTQSKCLLPPHVHNIYLTAHSVFIRHVNLGF